MGVAWNLGKPEGEVGAWGESGRKGECASGWKEVGSAIDRWGVLAGTQRSSRLRRGLGYETYAEGNQTGCGSGGEMVKGKGQTEPM